MARTNYISIMLCVLLFIALSLTPMARAPKQTKESSAIARITKKAGKKRGTITTQKTQRASQKTAKKAASKDMTKNKTISSVRGFSITVSKNAKTRNKHAVNKTASISLTEKCTKRKGYKSHCVKVKNAASGALVDVHEVKVQKVTKVAMNKLMQQVGKPYRQGGSSSRTGFDCSSLVCYAYKGLVKTCIPRTADETYHLRDAAPIERNELKDGDLVFFHTQGRGTVDHVGVYIGNGKSIQSPRTGQEIQITSLSEDYWQRHYVDACRVTTPRTLR